MFLFVYVVSISGYHENSINSKTLTTDAQIKKFEEDVLNGVVVDLESYTKEEYVDYSNIFTKSGEVISDSLITVFNSSIKGISKIFGIFL